MRPKRIPGRTVWLAAVVMLGGASMFGCAYSGQSEVQRADVRMRYSQFVPGHLAFEKGETVEFVITNADPIDHEFILGDEAVQQRHEAGTEAHHDAMPTEVSVPAGSTVRTRVTLAEAGEFIVGCHLPRHYDYGMKAFVVVNA